MSADASAQQATESAEPPDGPTFLRVAVLMLWSEATCLGFLTFFLLLELLLGAAENSGYAAALAVSVGLSAIGFLLLGRALTRRKRWARSVAVVAHLMLLPVSWFMSTGDSPLLVIVGGIVLGAIALIGAALLLAPSSRRAVGA